jgi:hypothetical protein
VAEDRVLWEVEDLGQGQAVEQDQVQWQVDGLGQAP